MIWAMTVSRLSVAFIPCFPAETGIYAIPASVLFAGAKVLTFPQISAHPTNPVEGCADANPKTMLPNDT